jgi:hypothetical protein
VDTYLRFVFCKERPVLEEALARLGRYLRPAKAGV